MDKKYRDEGYVNFAEAKRGCSKTWHRAKSGHLMGTSFEGDKSQCKVPSGCGGHSIVCHLGSAETGLLENCLLLYRGVKSNKEADYHSEMNASVFLSWLEKTVIPAIKATGKKTVLVLDRATYHTMVTPETKPCTRLT